MAESPYRVKSAVSAQKRNPPGIAPFRKAVDGPGFLFYFQDRPSRNFRADTAPDLSPMEDAMMKRALFPLAIVLVAAAIGCSGTRVKIFPDATDPLKEFSLSGKGSDKVLLIPIKGVISDTARERVFRTEPSMVEEVVSQLTLAEKDKHIRAVVLKIDSPGGSVTATDLLYHELVAFKKKTGVKLVAVMMNLAASGGYYIALPADRIIAHPTTVTGSIGVLLLRPDVSGLMEKIGLDVAVSKSGRNKDMGSPFRKATAEEEKLLQEVSDTLGRRFVDLVARHRKLAP
jgi:protease-4